MFPYLYLFLPAGAVFYFLLHLFPGLPAHPPAAQPSVPLPSGYALSWNDEFGGASLDMEKWFYRQTGPRHDAVNTPEAVSAGNGILSIRTYTENGKHHTGMIATKKKSLDRTYGFYEASIEFTGDRNASSGMWSAFWLQSDTISTVGNTGKYGTEIDIVEYRPNPANGYETNQAIHYHGYGEHHKSAAKQHKIGLLEGYHTYGVLRTAGGYTFYMDGKEVWKTQEA
uniref:glycoside hydrolase family 16 protein n=1 Tax=Akkermansia sp. TaxID=1872421 RepID=UPI003AF6BEED